MQTTLRAGPTRRLFPEHANFVALKDKGVLLSPEEAASRVLAYLARSDFGSQPVADVRDAGTGWRR
jgi:benzil reductase ((S)-benzoin forming)